MHNINDLTPHQICAHCNRQDDSMGTKEDDLEGRKKNENEKVERQEATPNSRR